MKRKFNPQQNPNAWSCLPTAFAISQHVPVEDWIRCVGHDGSEIVRAGLPDPLCRRGFHPQEMIRLCLLDGYAVTRVELAGQSTPALGTYEAVRFDFGGWDSFVKQMYTSRGVLDVRTNVGTGHAMAYEGQGDCALICDPANNSVFEFKNVSDAENRNRFIVALWRIDLIDVVRNKA